MKRLVAVSLTARLQRGLCPQQRPRNVLVEEGPGLIREPGF